MEKNSKYIRKRSRRKKKDLSVCQDCKSKLTEDNWTPSCQKYKRYICGACWVARQQKYAANNPNFKQLRNEQRKKREESWSEERKEIEKRKKRNYLLKRNYNITIEQYEEILSKQGYKCAICKTTESLGKGFFHVDHCHNTEVIRGLLCSRCNMMLGMVDDDILKLQNAIKYLKKKS